MCGLAGFWNRDNRQSADEMLNLVKRMASTLHHRGPDDSGATCHPDSGIALGFQRLSIVDLSPAGHQPMTSSCGRFVIVFNGEIYNHVELRRDLIAKGHSFRGHSDTEVLCEGFAEWGIEPTIQKCIGMFAIAAWDTQQRELTLIRDRLGKKPLYYGRFGSTLLFGSETKALRAHPAFIGEIDRDHLAQLLRWCFIPNPGTIYRNIVTLRPGTTVTLRADADSLPDPVPYWSFTDVAERGVLRTRETPAPSYDEAAEQLDGLLTDAVGRRMVADVPLGAFLSGGIDSSLVVALMQKQSSRPIKTFTIGFEEEAFNEAPFAKRVAEHLKTDHTELYVTAQQARDVIPKLPTIFDEPFADSSQIPTYLVSRLARQHVTVSLSGDGGDELFCGYRRYFDAFAKRPLDDWPHWFRDAMSYGCRTVGHLPLGRLALRFQSASKVFGDVGPIGRYHRNLSHWDEECNIVLHAGRVRDPNRLIRQFDDIQQVFQWGDTLRYLPDDILVKVDRASMAVSLEARTPLLDHRVVELAWALPHSFKVADGKGKRILRSVLSRYVPTELFERPKVGFGVPIDAWLRGPLRDWAEALLDEGRLKREGYLNPRPIRQKWQEHLTGRADWHYLLWDVLMFQAWLEVR